MKYLLILLGLMLVVSCTPTYNKKMPDINVIAKDILKGYQYEIIDRLIKPQVKIQTIKFLDKIDNKDFYSIRDNLINRGWELVYDKDDQYVFCRDEYNEIKFMYPVRRKYIGKNGGEIFINDSSLNKWGASYYYNNEGTEYCKK